MPGLPDRRSLTLAKYPVEKEKVNEIKEFIELTWEAVRRNPNYRNDYLRFLQNYGLSPEDVKERTNPDGSKKDFFPPGRSRKAAFDPLKGRFVWNEEASDPKKCNLTYMLDKWGFADDPDEAKPRVSHWSPIFSREWRKKMKSKKSHFSPVIHVERHYKKLPGILKVNQFPEVRLEHKGMTMFQSDDKGRVCQIESLGGITVLYGSERVEDRPKLTMPDGANLTLTVNLEAPSKLIRYALETLIEMCKAELEIPDKRLEPAYKKKCFRIFDLYSEGYSLEDIADLVDLNHYKEEEAMKDGLDEYLRDWGVPQVKRCLKDAEKMIEKGSII
jgi:hypothetical protein